MGQKAFVSSRNEVFTPEELERRIDQKMQDHALTGTGLTKAVLGVAQDIAPLVKKYSKPERLEVRSVATRRVLLQCVDAMVEAEVDKFAKTKRPEDFGRVRDLCYAQDSLHANPALL